MTIDLGECWCGKCGPVFGLIPASLQISHFKSEKVLIDQI